MVKYNCKSCTISYIALIFLSWILPVHKHLIQQNSHLLIILDIHYCVCNISSPCVDLQDTAARIQEPNHTQAQPPRGPVIMAIPSLVHEGTRGVSQQDRNQWPAGETSSVTPSPHPSLTCLSLPYERPVSSSNSCTCFEENAWIEVKDRHHRPTGKTPRPVFRLNCPRLGIPTIWIYIHLFPTSAHFWAPPYPSLARNKFYFGLTSCATCVRDQT